MEPRCPDNIGKCGRVGSGDARHATCENPGGMTRASRKDGKGAPTHDAQTGDCRTSHVRLRAVARGAAPEVPDHALAFVRATQAMNARRWHAALAELRQAMAADRSVAVYQGAFVRCLLHIYPEASTSMEALDKMLHIIDRAVELDAMNDSFYYTRGLVLERMGSPRGARAEFEHAVSLNPKNIDAKRKLHLTRKRRAAQESSQGVLSRLFKRR